MFHTCHWFFTRRSMNTGQSRVASSATGISPVCPLCTPVPNNNWHENTCSITELSRCRSSTKQIRILFSPFSSLVPLFLLLCDSSSSCPQNMSSLCRYAQGLSPAWKSSQLNVLYTRLKWSVCVWQRRRGSVCVHAPVMCAHYGFRAEILPPSGARLSFVRLQGVELRLTEIESPVNKILSDAASLLVNLRSSERLQRCMYVLKKYAAQVGPVVGVPVKWWEHRRQSRPYCTSNVTHSLRLDVL